MTLTTIITALSLAAPSPDAPTEELIQTLPTLWGQWPVFVGIVVTLLVRLWPALSRFVLVQLPTRWRGAVAAGAALVFSALPMAGAVLLVGGTWGEAGGAFISGLLQAFAVTMAGAEGLRMLAGKPVPPAPKDDDQKPHIKILPVSLVLLVLLASGCAASLETARDVGTAGRELGAPGAAVERDDAACERIDRRHATWGAVAKGAAFAAGSSGLGGVVVQDEGAAIGMAVGAVAAGSVAAGAVVVSERAAARWAEECSP